MMDRLIEPGLSDGEDRRSRRRRRARWEPAPSGLSGNALLRHEVDRSRRHDHPLALVRLPVSDGQALTRAYREVAALKRSVDVVWVESRDVFVLLPEADRTGAKGFLARVRAAASPALALAEVRLACFPEDGLTPAALRQAVLRRPVAPPVTREPLGAPSLQPLE
jgi:hypothetical protein